MIISQIYIDFSWEWANDINVIIGHRRFGDIRPNKKITNSIFLGKLGEWATTLHYRMKGWIDFPEPNFGNGDDCGVDFYTSNGNYDTKSLWKDEVINGNKSKVFLPGPKNFRSNTTYVLFFIDRENNYSAEFIGSKLGKKLNPTKRFHKSYTFINNFKEEDQKIYDNLLNNLKF